jgi:hypothetical protein
MTNYEYAQTLSAENRISTYSIVFAFLDIYPFKERLVRFADWLQLEHVEKIILTACFSDIYQSYPVERKNTEQ